ncbi:MAG TPA: peptide ABC transporter permease [Chloroflexi bacterium]|nr:peptide ABC transporter permease [Chloroflexota bacterium]
MKGQSEVVLQSPLEKAAKGESPWVKSWNRFRRHRLAMTGLIVIIVLALMAIFAPLLSPYSAYELNLADRVSPPNLKHWLGTDGTGRDTWARLLLGGRVSLSVGLVAVSISMAIGVLLGGLAGYFGGKVDMVIMRSTDTVMCFPSLIIIITLVAVVGPSIYNTMLVIGLLGWPSAARIVRGQFLYLREQLFVEAAKCLGVPPLRIAFLHILPNAIGPVVVAATFGVATAILMEAALSFLGLGVQIPTPSWGNMLQEAQTLTILEQQPWRWVPPGVMIVISVLSINFIGDGLRDALDPRMVL